MSVQTFWHFYIHRFRRTRVGRGDGGNSSVTLLSTQQAFPHGGKKRVQDDLPIRYQECVTADSKCMFI